MARIKFKSLSSGSCGNCYYLAIQDDDGTMTPILVDAGVSPRRLKKELLTEGLNISDIRGMLITHDHMDHIRSLGSYCKHLKFPVWATDKLHGALTRHSVTGEYISACRKQLNPEGWTDIVPGRIKVRWFEVPHDATQTVGYAIMLDNYKFVIMTDLGHMTKDAVTLSRQADTVVIESNYDLEMLRNGPYPIELQDRICLGGGHLSNADCADAIKDFLHEGMDYIFLCHLSEHNNTPQLALKEAKSVIEGSSVRLVPLPRQTPSPLFTLR